MDLYVCINKLMDPYVPMNDALYNFMNLFTSPVNNFHGCSVQINYNNKLN